MCLLGSFLAGELTAVEVCFKGCYQDQSKQSNKNYTAPVKPVKQACFSAFDHTTGNVIYGSKGRRVKVMSWKVRLVRQSEQMSLDTGKELETGECKLQKGKSDGIDGIT